MQKKLNNFYIFPLMRNFERFIWFFLCCFSLFCAQVEARLPEKPFVVVIPSYNNQQYVAKNLESVLRQNYSNFRVIYIDDASTDKTVDAVLSVVKKYRQERRVQIIRNQKRQGGLYNLYYAIHSCQDSEIIACVDGDDSLAHMDVLKKLNQVYSTQNVWLTHGTMMEYPSGNMGWSIPIPEEIIQQNAFRTYRCPTHLKTFYAWLFKKIALEDLQIDGQFFPMTQDQAIMFPMIEMAGERHAFISEPIYIYNMSNPINDNKVNAQLQNDLERLIRSKTPYSRLEE